MREGHERSRASYAREAPGPVRLVAMTPDLVERLRRVMAAARAVASGGRFPLVLEDANVLTVRLMPDPGCDPATAEAAESTLDAGERFLSVTEAARLLGCSPQAIRKVCGGPRLPATQFAGVWMIRESDFEHYRYERKTDG